MTNTFNLNDKIYPKPSKKLMNSILMLVIISFSMKIKKIEIQFNMPLLNDEYNYKQPIDMDLGELIGDLEDNDYEGNEWIWDIDKECIITLPNLEHYAVIVAELSIKNYVKLIQRFYPFKI